MKTTCFNAHLIQVFYSSFEHCQTSRTCLPSPNLWCALLLCPGEPLLIGPVINTIRGNINNLITMERNYLSQKDWAQDRVWSAEARGGPSLYAVPIKIAGLCPRHSDSFIITEQQHRVHTFRYMNFHLNIKHENDVKWFCKLFEGLQILAQLWGSLFGHVRWVHMYAFMQHVFTNTVDVDTLLWASVVCLLLLGPGNVERKLNASPPQLRHPEL